MFITKTRLPRRTFLRGLGTTLALPMLDAMVPALSAAPAAPAAVRLPLHRQRRHPESVDADRRRAPDFELTPILKPLEAFKSDINVISGLSHLQADTFGDGTGDHPRASAAWLTGVHAYDRTLPGVEVKLATSADQIIARHIGKNTPVSSIELSVDYPTQGACDSGDCFYVNTVSWRNETTPNPTELHPRVVFERLFGDGGTAAERLAHIRKTGSILDSVTPGSRAASPARSARATAASSASTSTRCATSNSASRTPRSRARTRSSCPIVPWTCPRRSRITRS